MLHHWADKLYLKSTPWLEELHTGSRIICPRSRRRDRAVANSLEIDSRYQAATAPDTPYDNVSVSISYWIGRRQVYQGPHFLLHTSVEVKSVQLAQQAVTVQGTASHRVSGKRRGQVPELDYSTKHYRWNIVGFCEVRWKKKTLVKQEGHKLYFSGSEDKHTRCVGFLIHKDTVDLVIGCRPSTCVSS